MLLIDAGADATLVSRDGGTPLDIAKNKGHYECARAIQEHAEASAPPREEVEIAAATADAGELPEALTSSLRAKLVSNVHSSGPVCTLEEVRAWLDGGGHVDATTEIDLPGERKGQKFTMLMMAALCGDDQLLDLLIASNATIDQKTSEGSSATVAAAGASCALLLSRVSSCFLSPAMPLYCTPFFNCHRTDCVEICAPQ